MTRSCGIIPIYRGEDDIYFLVVRSVHGKWGFPKGHQEKGETDLETAFRETKEEVSITEISLQEKPTSIQYSYQSILGPKTVILFAGFVSEKHKPICDDDVDEAEWLPYVEAVGRISHESTRHAFITLVKELITNMALFTGKGDGGTTKHFDTQSGKRVSKTSPITEALGSLDEVNSFLGLAKIRSNERGLYVGTHLPSFEHIVHELQETLFTVQAEMAGAEKTVKEERVQWMEHLIETIEDELPPITTFFISGGTELAATFDVARTLARRAERRVVGVHESGERNVGVHTLAFMNRLSSVLYALARLSNHKSGIKEDAPSYK